jgi:hypothetical protein
MQIVYSVAQEKVLRESMYSAKEHADSNQFEDIKRVYLQLKPLTHIIF